MATSDFELLEISMLRKILHLHFAGMSKKMQLQSDRFAERTDREGTAEADNGEEGQGQGGGADKRRSMTMDEKIMAKISKSKKHAQINTVVPLHIHGNAPAQYNMKRLVDDFVFTCILVGNDFLPHLPHLNIAGGGLSLLMETYGTSGIFSRYALFMGNVQRKSCRSWGGTSLMARRFT